MTNNKAPEVRKERVPALPPTPKGASPRTVRYCAMAPFRALKGERRGNFAQNKGEMTFGQKPEAQNTDEMTLSKMRKAQNTDDLTFAQMFEAQNKYALKGQFNSAQRQRLGFKRHHIG